MQAAMDTAKRPMHRPVRCLGESTGLLLAQRIRASVGTDVLRLFQPSITRVRRLPWLAKKRRNCAHSRAGIVLNTKASK